MSILQNETVGKDTATLVIHARILRWLELVPESTTLDTTSDIRDTRKRGVLYIHVQESRTTIENECNSYVAGHEQSKSHHAEGFVNVFDRVDTKANVYWDIS